MAAVDAADKKELVFQELVLAEQSYVGSLRVLVTKFVQPLKAMGKSGEVDAATVQRIVSNAEDIASFHELFLGELKRAETGLAFAEAFLKYADFLKMYTLYVNNYDRSCDAVDSLRKHAKFQSFLKKQRKDPACNGNNFMSFLIMPVQRIPLYELLLDKLMRACERVSPADPALPKLREAIGKVTDIASYVNEDKRRAEERTKLMDLRARLTGDDGFVLITPTRKLLREGELQKLAVFNFKRTRRFFLFNDLLLWTTSGFKIRGYVDLAPAQASAVPPDHPDPAAAATAFEVFHPRHDTLVLYAATDAERRSWLRDLNAAIGSSAQRSRDLRLRTRLMSQVDSDIRSVLRGVADPEDDREESGVQQPLAGSAPAWEAEAAAVAKAKKKKKKQQQQQQPLSSPTSSSSSSRVREEETERVISEVAGEVSMDRELELAVARLSRLDYDDVLVLIDMDDPPVLVRKVLEAVAIVMGVEPEERRHAGSSRADYWGPTQDLILKTHFWRLLMGHAGKRLRVPESGMDELGLLVENPLLAPSLVTRFSPAAGVLWDWVRALYNYQASREVAAGMRGGGGGGGGASGGSGSASARRRRLRRDGGAAQSSRVLTGKKKPRSSREHRPVSPPPPLPEWDTAQDDDVSPPPSPPPPEEMPRRRKPPTKSSSDMNLVRIGHRTAKPASGRRPAAAPTADDGGGGGGRRRARNGGGHSRSRSTGRALKSRSAKSTDFGALSRRDGGDDVAEYERLMAKARAKARANKRRANGAR